MAVCHRHCDEGVPAEQRFDDDARYSLQKIHIAAAVIDHAHIKKVMANRAAGQRHQHWLIKQPRGGDGKSHNAGDVVRCESDRDGKRAGQNDHENDGIDEHGLHAPGEANVGLRVRRSIACDSHIRHP
jgi:hypothetical protein